MAFFLHAASVGGDTGRFSFKNLAEWIGFSPEILALRLWKGTIPKGSTINNHYFPGATPPKTNMEPENGPLEKEIPIGNHHFQVPC